MPREGDTRLVYSTENAAPGGARPARKGRAAPRAGEGVRIRLERRASGRLVTLVTGIPGAAAEWAELARALKSACGAGGSVKDGKIELQGDHREAVESALRGRGFKPKRAGG